MSKRSDDLLDKLKSEALTWFEEIKIYNDFHILMQKEQGGAERPGRPHRKIWGLRESADKLGTSYGGLCQDIKLYRTIEMHQPELKNHKLKRDALREAREKWWER